MAIYLDIAQTLEREIEVSFKPGEFLDSEHQLSDRFQVNRHTLRRAVDELIKKGLIQRQHGRGMMVTSKPLDYPLHSRPCFTENLAETGKFLHTKVLSCRLMPVMENLQTVFPAPIHQVVEIKTLRIIDGQPANLINHTLNLHQHFKTLQKFSSGSLHSFLKDNFGLSLRRGRTLIRARMPTESEINHLMLPKGVPVIRLETCNYVSMRHFSGSHISGVQDPVITDIPLERSISINRS